MASEPSADRGAWPNGMPRVGQSARRSRDVTAGDIERFTEISGDRNPLHYDEALARASRFGGIVVQGGVTSAILNAVVAEARRRRDGRVSAWRRMVALDAPACHSMASRRALAPAIDCLAHQAHASADVPSSAGHFAGLAIGLTLYPLRGRGDDSH